MRISSAILFFALIGGSLEPATAQLKLTAVPVDSAMSQPIRDSIEQARSTGDLPRVKRELGRLLELYPNDPAVRAPIYLALSQVSSQMMDATNAKHYEVAALTLNPIIGELAMAHKDEGVNRGGGDDKLSTILGVAVQIMTQVQQARQQRAANMPQPAQQMYPQANAFPAAPVGMQGAPPQQPNMPMPGGYSNGGPMVMGYDANNQPIYSQPGNAQPGNGQAAQPMQNQPAANGQYGQYPAPAGQMPAYPNNQPAYPAPQQQQAQSYPQQQAYPAQQQAYPPQQQQPYAPQQQQPYPPQQQPAYPTQQQAQAYPQQQSYLPQQQPYPAQQAYPQQGTQYGYPAPIQNPYATPANYARHTTRGAELPSIRMFYDRFHAGDAAYFQNPCASLLDVDPDGTVTLTPGCGEKALVIPASDIVDIRMNVAVARQVGAFHIETAKGLYLSCTGPSGTREESLDIVRSLRQKLALGE